MRKLRLLVREAGPGAGDPSQRRLHWLLSEELEQPYLAEADEPFLAESQVRLLLPDVIERSIVRFTLDGPVRLSIRCDQEELDRLPWESLAENRHGQDILVIRESGDRPATSDSTSESRVTVAFANPSGPDSPSLRRLGDEVCGIENTVKCLAPGVRVDRVAHCTPAALQAAIADGETTIMHFAGHAQNRITGSVLLLEGAALGAPSHLYAEDLVRWLKRSKVSVVVLSACDSLSIGYDLVRGGVSAVVCMQTAVTDTGASLFSNALYSGLAQGRCLADAVHEARLRLYAAGEDASIPVLICLPGGADLRPIVARRAEFRFNRSVLPQDSRPLLGREAERNRVIDSVRKSEIRLVTLSGMGGMGKTRLAMSAAWELKDRYRDGAYWVDCSEYRAVPELVSAIALTLGLESAVRSPEDLTAALANAEMLLVLDCFEGLAEHADALRHLLERTRNVDFLVTSRKLLKISFEHEIEIGPLVEKGRNKFRASIGLFEQAARQASPEFRVTSRNTKLVRELVEALESVPLAIILAAGRLRVLKLEELAQRVRERRMEILRRPAVGNDRHATMLQVVEDSFSLLPTSERELMFELCVFHGGFGLSDAQSVLSHRLDLLDGIERLRDNSLVTVHDSAEARRFRILDTIREYVDQVAEPASLDAVRRSHATYFVSVAERLRHSHADGDWKRANQALWREVGNLKAATAYAIRADERLVCRSAAALARWYLETGLRNEFDRLAKAAEKAAESLKDPRLIIELRGLQGESRRRDQDYAEAIALWMDRVRRCKEEGDIEGAADSLTDVANLGLVIDEPEITEEMLAHFAMLDASKISAAVRATALVIEARLELRSGRTEDAIGRAAHAEELIASVGTDPQVLYVYMSLAQLHRAAGSLDTSERLARRLITMALEVWHLQSVARGLLELARTRDAMEDPHECARALAAAGAMPARVSTQVRGETKEAQEAFVRRWGREALNAELERGSSQDWRVLADQLGLRESSGVAAC